MFLIYEIDWFWSRQSDFGGGEKKTLGWASLKSWKIAKLEIFFFTLHVTVPCFNWTKKKSWYVD